jgi:hypothetical protein
MNARPSPCHALHEPISLLAAGCLPPEEQAAVADGLPRPPARSTRPLALPFAAAIAAALLVAAWWMADQQATPPPAESPSRIHLAIHELAHADTDAEFDEALRRHYGSAMFGASGPTSRARDLMKEFLE